MRVLNLLSLFLLKIYQTCISPLIPPCCRFDPSCSRYAVECFQKFSFCKALKLTTKRLLRCHPFYKGGWDPVPDPIKFKNE